MIKFSYGKIKVCLIGNQININQVTNFGRNYSLVWSGETSLQDALDRTSDEVTHQFSDNEAKMQFQELRVIGNECDWDAERLLSHPSIRR